MLWPTQWEAVLERFDADLDDDNPAFDRYDEATHAQAVAMLPPHELALALMSVKGCGCCVNGAALNLRHAVLERVKAILETVEG